MVAGGHVDLRVERSAGLADGFLGGSDAGLGRGQRRMLRSADPQAVVERE